MNTTILILSVEFANDGTDILFANDLKVGEDGWAMIAPVGDHPGLALLPDGRGGFKKVPAIQRIDSTAVAQMVNEFKASSRGVKRYLAGRPIYVGHPDVPGYEAKYPDKSPKGVFSDLQARVDGLYGLPVFTNEGSELVESKKLRALSGRWSAAPAGEENGKQIFRPDVFISAGLTNSPNLPVQLLNEAESDDAAAAKQAKNTNMNKALLLALLAKLGLTFANDATDEQINGGLQQAQDKLTTLDGEKTTLANEKETLSSTVTAKDTEIATLKTERDLARTNFANERQARIGGIVTLAIKEGRITAAEKADWERRLGVEASFANESEAISKLTPKVKTSSVTLQLGERKVELANETERGQFLNEAIAEICREKGWNPVAHYQAAFNEAQKRHPQLFQAMQQPEIKTKGTRAA